MIDEHVDCLPLDVQLPPNSLPIFHSITRSDGTTAGPERHSSEEGIQTRSAQKPQGPRETARHSGSLTVMTSSEIFFQCTLNGD